MCYLLCDLWIALREVVPLSMVYVMNDVFKPYTTMIWIDFKGWPMNEVWN